MLTVLIKIIGIPSNYKINEETQQVVNFQKKSDTYTGKPSRTITHSWVLEMT